MDEILIKLIRNVSIIPYTIRCICKIIFFLIDHKVNIIFFIMKIKIFTKIFLKMILNHIRKK